jgi:UDP-N-acetylglucosamine:LPS N-acetylglucosamine transferase
MNNVKILAISSSGGHWIQLLRLKKFFGNYTTFYASTDSSLASMVEGKFYSLRDASMWDKPGLVILAFQIIWLLMKARPDVIVTTGAAAGFFAIVFGKFIGAKTIWIDSMANADEMSLAGMKVKKFADVWLTQWPALATDKGPYYRGQVL